MLPISFTVILSVAKNLTTAHHRDSSVTSFPQNDMDSRPLFLILDYSSGFGRGSTAQLPMNQSEKRTFSDIVHLLCNITSIIYWPDSRG